MDHIFGVGWHLSFYRYDCPFRFILFNLMMYLMGIAGVLIILLTPLETILITTALNWEKRSRWKKSLLPNK